MGVEYNIYTEVLLNGTWLNIDNRVLGLDNKIHTAPVIWGKSWLWEALHELSSDVYAIEFEKLSVGTKAILEEDVYTNNRRYETVDFQTAIKDKTNSSPSRIGYVYRSSIVAFQTGEIDCIEEFLTPGDYAELDKDEQKEYSYYEWDDREGWFAIFKTIAYRVDFLVDNFNNCGVSYEMYDDLDERQIKAKNVRLIIVSD